MDCQELFTENLKLRKAKKDDLQLIWKNVWQDEEIAKNMLWEVTKTEEKAHIRLEKTITYMINESLKKIEAFSDKIEEESKKYNAQLIDEISKGTKSLFIVNG